MFSKSRSLRLRLTFLFVLIFGATLVGFAALLYQSFVMNNQTLFDTELYNHAIDVSETVDVDPFGRVTMSGDPFSRRGKVALYSIGKTLLQIRAFDGRILARSRSLGNAELPMGDHDRRLLEKSGYNFSSLERKNMRRILGRAESGYRMIEFVVQKFPSNQYILQLAVPLAILEKEERALFFFNLVAIPTALILAAFGGLFLSRKALAPVNEIIAKTRKLSHTNLSERLSVPRVDDEIKQLTLTLNELFDRLERGFKTQERFVSDASHELRTPLAILRGELDLLRSRDRSPAEVNAFAQTASQEIDRLARLVEDLLILARADMGKSFIPMKQVRLDELAIEASSTLERIAKPKDVKIRLDLSSKRTDAPESTPDFEVLGDADLLFSLLRNLIENAIKFSPIGGVVTVQLLENEKMVTLEISDQGPGIAPDILPRIFDRFYRANSSGDTQGFGLGLAIVQQIIEVHKAKLGARSSEHGTTIHADINKF